MEWNILRNWKNKKLVMFLSFRDERIEPKNPLALCFIGSFADAQDDIPKILR